MKNKIMFFLPSLKVGGAERTIVNLIRNIDSDIFEITLVLAYEEKVENGYLNLIPSYVKVIYLKSTKLRYAVVRLAKMIRKMNPDLIFSTINGANIIVFLANLISFNRKPIILRESTNLSQVIGNSKIKRILTKYCYNNASRIISLSYGVKEDLVKNLNIDTNNISVIYNPVEVDSINELKRQDVEEIQTIPMEKVIVAVGRLVDAKGYDTLLKAFSIILNKGINARLIIVGEGDNEKIILELMNQLNLENKVDLVGYQENPYKFMNIADLFVLASVREGFGHVLVEAMAVGIPVIATRCSGPMEILENGEHGIMVDIGDYNAIALNAMCILEDEKERTEWIKKGMTRAKEFDAKYIVKLYEQLFLDYSNNSIFTERERTL